MLQMAACLESYTAEQRSWWWRDNDFVRVLIASELFQQFSSMLEAPSLASLYLALPRDLRASQFSTKMYKFWLRRHVKNEGVDLAITDNYAKINLASYLAFVHLHQHSLVSETRLNDIVVEKHYITDIFHGLPMYPPMLEFVVQSVLFLPMEAPGIYSGNLVILAREGRVLFYAPGEVVFRQTASIELEQYTAHNLACSPKGRTLVIADCNRTVILLLGGDNDIRCLRTDIPMAKYGFRPECFTDDNTWLSWDERNINLMSHTVIRRNKYVHSEIILPGHKLVNLMDRLLNWMPECMSRRCVVYKRPSNGSESCLLLTEYSFKRGLGELLYIIFDPWKKREQAVIKFANCHICSYLLDPEHTKIFVIVLTRSSREEFYKPGTEQAPKIYTIDHGEGTYTRWTAEERIGRRGEVNGTVAVYEIVPGINNTIDVRPRFYLGEMKVPENEAAEEEPPPRLRRRQQRKRFPHYMYDSDDSKREPFVQGQCDKTHLSIRTSWRYIATIPLIADNNCDIVYVCRQQRSKFAFSSEHNYAAFLRGEDFLVAEFMCGERVCPTYLRFAADTNRLPLQSHVIATCRPVNC
jgi:hypothetical protein